MRKRLSTAALALALGAGAGVGAAPANAVGPNCAVNVSIPAYYAPEVQPKATVTLKNCGSGQGKLEVKRSGATTPVVRSLGRISDGTHTSFVGSVSVGSYTVRAVVDGAASRWVPLNIVNVPTADAVPWKLVGEATNAWGKFDTKQPLKAYSEVRIGNRWSRSQTVTTDASGRYVVPLTYGADTPGVYNFRVTAQYPGGQQVSTPDFFLERVAGTTAASVGVKELGAKTAVWGKADVFDPTQVWTEVWLGNRWSRSQSAMTKDNGGYAIPLTYGANSRGTTKWRVGSIIEGRKVYSKEFFLQRVRPITASTVGRKRVGEQTNVWGTVDVSAPISVWTEVWNGKRWSRSQTRTTKANGGYAIPLTYGADKAGTYRYRVAAQYPRGVLRSDEITIQRVR